MTSKVAREDWMSALVEAIARHGAEHGYPPTIRDLQLRTGASSTSVVLYRLRACEREGVIIRVPERARAITLTARGRALLAGLAPEGEPASAADARPEQAA